MRSSNLISEFEAAQEVKISPTLLRWFTSYAAKDDGRKLMFEIRDGLYYYDKKELLDFSSYLHLPWAKPPRGTRPSIPAGIITEIKTESHYRCPICNTNMGELAHIKPVSKTFDNHPHNLIYLCPNHHTAYDFGARYANISEEEVLLHKKALQNFQSISWGLQGQIINTYLSLINAIGRVKELEHLLLNASTEAEFDSLLQAILAKIDKLKSTKNVNPKIDQLIESVKVDRNEKSPKEAYLFLSVKEEIEKEYQQDKGLIKCPLCNSRGYTDLFDICPVCVGDGYINKKREVDISIYEIENCPLCKGRGQTNEFETCPPCHGQGKLTKEQIEIIDFSIYEIENCPLCEGRGYTDEFDSCPPCGGEGKLTKEQIETIDFSIYEMENCPLCNGRGYTDEFDSCPPCGGEGKLTKEQIEIIDFSIYKMENCPLCKGKGHTNEFESCPPCGGEGKLTKEQIEIIDFSIYEMEDCPLCEGRGHTDEYESCPPCHGEGRLTRDQIDQIDFDQF
ncbi:zinc finger domain-containing protein [Dinghuibacter silviterrae]|uniref:HNH endonuclease n=1 Tax=Dinghuibacter silviterrae TaxID=1539049 RepID=A0A4R8DVU4_9BACT|nr:HNH endonuclease signature motif containing protein [Dinghuibacter silviterrae]TDX02176.1 HNH endonuclease [Dinghuibacter silviterrae]